MRQRKVKEMRLFRLGRHQQFLYIQDPTLLVQDIVGRKVPCPMFVLKITLKREFFDILNDHSAPRVTLWDDAIVSVESTNYRDAGQGFYCCAHCGGGLDLTQCSACNAWFEDDYFRMGWSAPLPPKIIKFLRDRGHTFALDPERLLPQ